MIPGTFALNIYRGDTHAWRFTVWLDAEKAIPADFTLLSVKAEIRDRPGGPVIVPLSVQITPPNVIDVIIPATQSRTLPASGRWDLQFTDAAGVVATLLAGAVTVIADVTDSDLAMRRAAAARRTGYLTEEPTR